MLEPGTVVKLPLADVEPNPEVIGVGLSQAEPVLVLTGGWGGTVGPG